jgi:hypothetical protein
MSPDWFVLAMTRSNLVFVMAQIVKTPNIERRVEPTVDRLSEL